MTDNTEDTWGEIKRRTVLKSAGAATVGAGMLAAPASAHSTDCVDCVFLGKVDRTPEEGDSYTFEYNGTTVTIDVIGVCEEDGEVVGAAFGVESGEDNLCRIDVKGGPETETYEYPTGAVHTGHPPDGCRSAPENDNNPNRTYYEISNVSFYFCVRDGTNEDEETSGEDDTNGGRPENAGPDGAPAKGRGRGPDR